MVASVKYTRQDPIGLDSVLQPLQLEVFDFVQAKWSGNIKSYGRVYRNERTWGSKVPEWYTADGDYDPVYYDDKYSTNFFFLDDETHETEDGMMFNAKVKLIFMVNLQELLPSIPHRADEEVKNDIVGFLNRASNGRFTITAFQKGIEPVFLGLDKDKIMSNDIHPKHVFSVRMTVNYYIPPNC